MKTQEHRSTFSIVLNYIEGYARKRPLVQLSFYENAYGSFKESKYLLHFSFKQGFLNDEDLSFGSRLAEEIGAMLWTEIRQLESSLPSR